MRVLIVGGGPGESTLGAELEAAGIDVDRRPDEPAPVDGSREIAQIAADLRELERTLSGSGPAAVLVASDSPAGLAAVVVATKEEIPVASLLAPGDGKNAHLICQLADAVLARDAVAVLDWIRDGYPARA